VDRSGIISVILCFELVVVSLGFGNGLVEFVMACFIVARDLVKRQIYTVVCRSKEKRLH